MRGIAVLLAVVGATQPVAAAVVTEVHYVMGTYLRVTADGRDAASTRAALRRCFATARVLDARFSRFDAHSELSRLNATAADAPIIVSPEMAALLRAALQLRGATGGTFDVSAGALTSLWRTANDWPSAETLATARRTAGEGRLDLVGTTLVRRAGVRIDLDGIAKGWAVDRCVALLRADGIQRAFVSFGESSLYALGAPTGEQSWTVWVRSLDAERALGTLALKDQAVSISAVFGHQRRVGSRRVGHIVDPRSGLPLTSPALAVVVAAAATDAEALSKAYLIDAHAAAAGRERIVGALLVGRRGIERVGRIPFTPFPAPQPIAAAAEPLR
jgi:FAD:protein FMN transferase